MINRSEISFSKENQIRNNKGMSLADAQKNAKIAKLGEGRGLAFLFRKDEEIVFPKEEEAFPFVKEFRGTEVLYISGYSVQRKRFVEIPLSTFRRIPSGEGELDSFYDENVRQLNCELAMMSTDLQRFIKLCQIGAIKCDDLFEAHQPVFETDAEGKVHRTDRLRKITIAAISVLAE